MKLYVFRRLPESGGGRDLCRRIRGATFSALSLGGLSHNDCRRWLLTRRSVVRILFAEPLVSTSNSRTVRLTVLRRVSREYGQNERDGAVSGEWLCRPQGLRWHGSERVSHVLRIGLHFWLTAAPHGMRARGSAARPGGACLMYYDRTTGEVRLADDVGGNWRSSAMRAGRPLGNSQCTVDPAESQVTETCSDTSTLPVFWCRGLLPS